MEVYSLHLLQPDQWPRGAQGFAILLIRQEPTQEREQSKHRGVGRRSASVSDTTRMDTEHIAETLVPMSVCFLFTRPKVHRHHHCQVAGADVSLNSSARSQSLSGALLSSTLTARSKHVRRV